MLILRLLWGLCAVTFTALGAGVACSQHFPDRPIRVVTTPTGGGNDFVARLLSPELGGRLGQQVIVENRAGGVIPGEIVAKATPDGHTLLLSSNFLWYGPLLQKARYELVRDFLPITLAVNSPNVVVVHPSVPVKSVKELISLAKEKPGNLNYASSSAGAANHLAAELFKSMASIDIVCITYKGTGPALNDLIGGQVQLMFANTVSVASHLKSARLKALAVTSAQPSELLPGMPTVAASGIPGYEASTIFGLFAPAGTADKIIGRLNQGVVNVLNTPEIKDRLLSTGVEVVGSSPAGLSVAVKADLERMEKVIKNAGIRVE